MTENYFDGEWRPVTNTGYTAMEKLRTRGFELGNDRYGKLMARWPVAPAAPVLPEGVTVRYSHGRYIASDGKRYGGWAETEAAALEKWQE